MCEAAKITVGRLGAASSSFVGRSATGRPCGPSCVSRAELHPRFIQRLAIAVSAPAARREAERALLGVADECDPPVPELEGMARRVYPPSTSSMATDGSAGCSSSSSTVGTGGERAAYLVGLRREGDHDRPVRATPPCEPVQLVLAAGPGYQRREHGSYASRAARCDSAQALDPPTGS